jgi:hypothetical protein
MPAFVKDDHPNAVISPTKVSPDREFCALLVAHTIAVGIQERKFFSGPAHEFDHVCAARN